jgi:cell division control protein 6
VPQYRSIFKDETKLDINYVPYKLPHRETELRLLMEFFSFELRTPEKMAQRVIIAGDVGTGKTVVAQRFGNEISNEAIKLRINLRYIHVNCREYRGSLFLILHRIVSIFHPNFPSRGYSAEELLGILIQILDDENAYVIVALDEFESLIEREGSEAVYKLTRLQETRQNRPQRLSLICVLRSLKIIDRLDSSTRSSLQSNVINLEKYSEQQLRNIINDRVSLAFKPSSVSEETISLIADLASSESGNARFGIELLWRSGKYADAENLEILTPECVRKAVSGIISIMRKDELIPLSFHEKLFLMGIARAFAENQKACISLIDAEQAYSVLCEEFNVKSHSHTQLWKYLKALSALGILKTRVSTTDFRGRSTLVYLPNIPAYELEKELKAILDKEAR